MSHRSDAAMNDVEVHRWRTRLRAKAAYWAKAWAWHQDQRALMDDLEGVGWEILCRLGVAHPRLRWELQNAMQDAICWWLYGVSRGQRPRRIRFSNQEGIIEMLTLPSRELDPLQRVLLKEALATATARQWAQWERHVWPRHGRDYRMTPARVGAM